MFSILFGVLASVLPNLLFYWLYKLAQVQQPNKFIKKIYLSGGLKFAATAILQSAALQWPGLQPAKFFIALMATEFLRFVFVRYVLARKTAT